MDKNQGAYLYSNKNKSIKTRNPSIVISEEFEDIDEEEITNAGIEIWNCQLNEGFEETETQSKIV